MTSIGPSAQWTDTLGGTAERNPYSNLLNQINQVAFPEYSEMVRKVLIAFGCIHAITVLVCIFVLWVPLRRGPEARIKHTWLLRKQYVPSISTPYHVMNSGLVVVISQLASSLVFVTYILLDYWSLNSTSFILRAYLHVCWELCLLPGYFGFHVTAFSSLYTCLCSPRYSGKPRNLFSHPLFLNILFYVLPVIVTIQTVAWSVVLALGVEDESDAYNSLVSYLEYAAADWFPGQDLNNPVHRLTTQLLRAYVRRGKYFMICWVWSSRTWSSIGLALAVFYAVNVARLLQLLRQSLKASRNPMKPRGNLRAVTDQQLFPSSVRGKAWSPESPHEQITEPQATAGGMKNYSPSVQAPPSFKELRNGYIYLIVHCSIMLLNLLIHTICAIIRTVHADQAVADKRWRSRTTWLVLLGSTLASLAMIFQSWRIFTERDTTHISASTPGIRVRNFFSSNRDEPGSDAANFNVCLDEKKATTGPNASQATAYHGVSSNPADPWPTDPSKPIRSPLPLSGLDLLKVDYISIEMSRMDQCNDEKR